MSEQQQQYASVSYENNREHFGASCPAGELSLDDVFYFKTSRRVEKSWDVPSMLKLQFDPCTEMCKRLAYRYVWWIRFTWLECQHEHHTETSLMGYSMLSPLCGSGTKHNTKMHICLLNVCGALQTAKSSERPFKQHHFYSFILKLIGILFLPHLCRLFLFDLRRL